MRGRGNGWLGGGICTIDSIEEGDTITNNTIVANSGSGIFWQNASPNIANNIVAYNTWGLEQIENLFTYPIIKSNCVYGNRVKAQVADFKGLADPIGTNGNISAEPKLAAYYIGDFHIQPDSPCIDTGDMNSLGIDWVDIEDQNRVQGLAVDMGADESDGTHWDIAPNIVHVKPDGNDLLDGLSWATAKKTLTAGIDSAASTYGEVWVADGNYMETIILPAFIYLYGGFNGTESLREQRDIQVNPTIIDANKAGCAVTARTAGYLVSTVDGFTVKNGSPLIQAATLINRGCGFNILCCSPVIANNTITENQADDPLWPGFLLDGGGFYCYLSYPYIINNTFSQNKVNHSASGKGGAIYSYYSMPSIQDNTFYDNAASWGPAICAEASEPYIFRNTIYANQGPPYAQRGAITCYICQDFTIRKNLIAGNVAAVGGGINAQTCMKGQIVNNLIINNYAYEILSMTYGAGGGIFLEVPTNPNDIFLVVNNTITGNVASSLIEHQGGGIALSMLSDELVLANNIVAFNSSGIWQQPGTTGVPTVNNNCVYNTGSNYVRVVPGPNDVSVDPNYVDMLGGNYRLSGLSPLIDAGDNNSVPNELQTDGSKFPRFIDDLCTNDTGSGTSPIVDIGGYEFLRSDINSDGNLDFIDYALFASRWLESNCGNCGGAELTCDGQITIDDLAEFASYWLAGL